MRSNQLWWIRKRNRNGFWETIIYHGSLRDKPKGWQVLGRVE